MSDALLFDLFGVIARHQSAAGRDRLVGLAGAPGPVFWDAYWALRPPYDRGEVTGPVYWRQVLDALGMPDALRMPDGIGLPDTLGLRSGDRRIAALMAADIASWSAVDDDMVALIEELAASGRRIALLSNIPAELAVHYEEHHQWLRHFQVCALSCRIGHAKPERGAYEWCHRALGLEPARIMFVDDRAENVRAAEAIGMRGHLFTGSDRLRNELARPSAFG